jgi:hypothetical protein
MYFYFRIIQLLDGKGGGKGTRLNAKVSNLKESAKVEQLLRDYASTSLL